MTRAPDVSRLRFSDLADALGEMRRRGLRVSAPRRLVLQALFAADGPCSAEHLARALDLDPASVYRKLDMTESERPPRLGHILSQTVFTRGANVPFGELTVDGARARGRVASCNRLGSHGTRGSCGTRVARACEHAGAQRSAAVSDLDQDLILQLAPRLWIGPPGGGLLS